MGAAPRVGLRVGTTAREVLPVKRIQVSVCFQQRDVPRLLEEGAPATVYGGPEKVGPAVGQQSPEADANVFPVRLLQEISPRTRFHGSAQDEVPVFPACSRAFCEGLFRAPEAQLARVAAGMRRFEKLVDEAFVLLSSALGGCCWLPAHDEKQ